MDHPLQKYRTGKKKSLEDVAELLAVSAASVSRIENSKQAVTAEMAVLIERVTDGEVSRGELRPDLWPAPASQHADAGQ